MVIGKELVDAFARAQQHIFAMACIDPKEIHDEP